METYIALLRGINVSGQKKIKMDDLRSLFENLNFYEVITYIQSGNIVFKTEKRDQIKLVTLIREEIIKNFGFEVEVIILNVQEINEVFENNPFIKDTKKDREKFYVTFLSEKPSNGNMERLSKYDYNPEEYHIINATIYFYAPNGYGRAKMNNNFFEKILGVYATTRNWKTVHKLVDLTESDYQN